VFPGVVLALIVLSLTRLNWLRWVQPFANLTTALLTPGSALASAASRWILPARRDPSQTENERILLEQLEHAKLLFLQGEDENRKLRAQIAELQRGILLNPDLPVSPLLVPVVGTSSDLSSGLLRVRGGESLGITPNTVAVSSGLQVVGRVTSVSGATSLVQLFTSKAAGKISGRVMVDEPNGVGLRCLLEPLGDGRLRGQVESPPSGVSAPPPEAGQTVRLADERWPTSAQMLVLGKVESVEQDPASPLRTIVTVLPTLSVDRVSEVILRMVGDDSSGGKR
jgi:cell shape-determining protein MreC